jgi:hypothetical protein
MSRSVTTHGGGELFPPSALTYRIRSHFLEEGEDVSIVVEVSFCGAYRDGSAGTPDADFMTSILGAALAHDTSCNALLLDLAEFEYRWGNGLLRPLQVAEGFGSPLPIAMVVLAGPGCIGALETLVTPTGRPRPAWLHDSREAAFEHCATLALERSRELGATLAEEGRPSRGPGGRSWRPG